MSEESVALHYVCTREEARRIVDDHNRFWVSNCGCREIQGGCKRSRMDVCLRFREATAASDSGLRTITRREVDEILREAQEKHLVTRPFRDEATKTETEGICFCCDDCCGYFVDPGGYTCDKGSFIQQTDTDRCTGCLTCVEVCHFGARREVDGKLTLQSDKCHGCGLCVDVCPEGCVVMVGRG